MVADQAALCEGNLERVLRRAVSRSGAQTHRSGRSLAGGDACACPPKGRACWMLKLLAGPMVKLTEHKRPVARDSSAALGRK